MSGSVSGLIAAWFVVWLGSSSSPSKSMMIFPRVLRSKRVVRLGGGSVASPWFFRNRGLRLKLDLSLVGLGWFVGFFVGCGAFVGLGVSPLGGRDLPLLAEVGLISAVGGVVHAASFGVIKRGGPVIGEVVPSRSSLSVNRGSYESCSVMEVSRVSNPVRSSESSNLLMVIGLIVPSGVNLGGMVSASELGRLSSAAGGLGGRPCRDTLGCLAHNPGRFFIWT